jgi:hypothetical protein
VGNKLHAQGWWIKSWDCSVGFIGEEKDVESGETVETVEVGPEMVAANETYHGPLHKDIGHSGDDKMVPPEQQDSDGEHRKIKNVSP